MAQLSIPPKFACPPCCNWWVHAIKIYGSGVAFIGMTLAPSFVKINELSEDLKGDIQTQTQRAWWFFIFFSFENWKWIRNWKDVFHAEYFYLLKFSAISNSKKHSYILLFLILGRCSFIWWGIARITWTLWTQTEQMACRTSCSRIGRHTHQ